MSNIDKYNNSRRRPWKARCGIVLGSRRELREHQRQCILCQSNKKYFNQYSKAEYLGLEKPKYSEETRKKVSEKLKGENNSSHRLEVRAKISESMKTAHAEGRAHNIGECRWNNQPSYPESWFIEVLKNEFGLVENINYKREFSFHRFSLDFAWPDKKLCIEIDGEQHQFQEQKRRDIEKDTLLREEGWKEIRKSWKDIFNNPKSFISEVRNFIK